MGIFGGKKPVSVSTKLKFKTRLQISVPKGDNDEIVTAIVEDCVKDEDVTIVVPVHKGYYYSFPEDVPVRFRFIYNGIPHGCLALFVERYQVGNLFYAKFHIESEIERYQNREYFRVNIDLDAAIGITNENGEIDWESCKIKDLSGGGARIESPSSFAVEDKFVVKFSFLAKEYKYPCKVLRASQTHSGKSNLYGVQFAFETQKQQENLCKDLIGLQQVIRKNAYV